MEKVSKLKKINFVHSISSFAVQSLIQEVELTPKPGLVDKLDTGSHDDLTLDMMKISANSLRETFYNIAYVSYNQSPSQILREKIAALGRDGEKRMFEVTNGVNTHKGAIWSLGLLVSACSSGKGEFTVQEVLHVAGEIASYFDRFNDTSTLTNGRRVKNKYKVDGAKEQAELGFPHISEYALPSLIYARRINMSENDAKKYSLLSLIAHLDDTCILHRGGKEASLFAKSAASILFRNENIEGITELNDSFIKRNISPGGSADLLAATLFLDNIRKKLKY